MTEFVWTCHVCGKKRPDDKISVYIRHRTLPNGVEIDENIRYCNDKPACKNEAKHVTFIGKELK